MVLLPGILDAAPVTEVDTSGNVYAYLLKDSESGEILHWIPSSYQPEGEKSRQFAKNNTLAVEFHWSPDKTHLAVAEINYRFQGLVWILAPLGTSSSYGNLLTSEIEEEILKRTGLLIERFRFFVKKWHSDNHVELELSVRYH